MKSLIIYYSQTGNTKAIAGAIREGVSQALPCDVARLQDIAADDLIPYQLIGLGAPVWHRREPSNLMNFIEYSLTGMEGRHAFAFCTHGLLPGHFFARVVPAIAQRGLTVVGWRNWYCAVTMPEKPKPYFTDGHPDAIDLAEAKEFGRDVAERSRRIYADETDLIPVLPTGKTYEDLYPGRGSSWQLKKEARPPSTPLSRMLEQTSGRSFDVTFHREKCLYPRCTICIDNCPTSSIDMGAERPVGGKRCDRCWYCEQLCPRGAIEIDWPAIAKVINEHVAPGFIDIYKEAQARKRFRPLVPLEKVGWDTFWYTSKKRPRLKPL
ncbi:MAG: flavodoxin domain-containing protein [Dehalococcoidales bacterium]|jgi:ferredoxin